MNYATQVSYEMEIKKICSLLKNPLILVMNQCVIIKRGSGKEVEADIKRSGSSYHQNTVVKPLFDLF